MTQPGQFYLPEESRSYIFSFTYWRTIEKLRIDFGALEGEYDVRILYFDEELYNGTTKKEMKFLTLKAPPSYRLKNTNLYQVSIHLKGKGDVSIRKNPFRFSIIPIP